jgi:hypothetical protein
MGSLSPLRLLLNLSDEVLVEMSFWKSYLILLLGGSCRCYQNMFPCDLFHSGGKPVPSSSLSKIKLWQNVFKLCMHTHVCITLARLLSIVFHFLKMYCGCHIRMYGSDFTLDQLKKYISFSNNGKDDHTFICVLVEH